MNETTGKEQRYMEPVKIDWSVVKVKCEECLHFFRPSELQEIEKTYCRSVRACPKCREAIEDAKAQMDAFYQREHRVTDSDLTFAPEPVPQKIG